MNVRALSEPFPHFLFENFFSEAELQHVQNELKYLEGLSTNDQDRLATALDSDEVQASRNGIFLHDLFVNPWKQSLTYKHIRKVYDSVWFCDDVKKASSFNLFIYKALKKSNKDSTLISFYKNGDYYKSHHDSATLTFIIFLKTGIEYSGGNLIFTEFDNYKVHSKHNSAILFPSVFDHEVDKITTTSNSFVRTSISTFIGFR